MLRKLTLIAALFIAANAHAGNDLTISKLASDANTKTALQQVVKNNDLPSWILTGGTESPSNTVTLNGNKYQVATACKPHNCPAERIAIMYSKEKNVMAGVFSSNDKKNNTEDLLWFNITDDLSIDGKTVLFAALTGSLDNHPNDFNYK
ncbi:C-lysozyme inhibitor [Providencia sp. wls1943]|uniref:Ivy family C-type lysozyme inhibitor n=1 Tax=Providencia sp. wls1943 TaxID=2675150 RepID=UPI0012B58A6A|nr:Ivy family C-type lysozyme inhibitor [Providencia sp. wls1943]MTB67154.1 C-lysozyme inhibitor [Providencia sp. wls1943]